VSEANSFLKAAGEACLQSVSEANSFLLLSDGATLPPPSLVLSKDLFHLVNYLRQPFAIHAAQVDTGKDRAQQSTHSNAILSRFNASGWHDKRSAFFDVIVIAWEHGFAIHAKGFYCVSHGFSYRLWAAAPLVLSERLFVMRF
jgi:hypothetical protein